MSKIKAVIFDFGGVIIPQPQKAISAYARALGLSNNFLPELFLEGVPNNAFCKLERGELTLSEFYSHFDLEAKKKAKRELLDLPRSFNAQGLFQAMHGNMQNFDCGQSSMTANMLSASTILCKNGILTCVLTNNWIDEKNATTTSRFMKILRNYFNLVIESCRIGARKPESKIYEHTCKELGVRPEECAFLDDIGQNLKAASKLGIVGIKVKDSKKALKELEVLTDIKLLNYSSLLFPAPSIPSAVAHGYVKVKPDINIHFVQSGEGPAVILLHGFPDFWYGWRHQIPALANAGYRAIALDQRGYGESSSPHGVDEYSHKELCTDVILLMDKLGIGVATVVGHDWGGSLAWSLALKFPDRFRGVCGVNTPFYKTNPVQSPLVGMMKNPGVFDYQLYFQDPGVAEKELEHDIERSLSIFLQGYDSSLGDITSSTSNVRKRGGILVGFPEKMPFSSFVSPYDMKVYVNAFKENGFRGPLNWYRNYENNWEWLKPAAHRKITMPALMVTAANDMVLKPEYSYGMEEHVVNLKRLHIDKCCHWTMQEQPFQLNDGLIKWLDSIHIGSQCAKL